MAKSIKFKNGIFLNTTGIEHGIGSSRKLLSDILNSNLKVGFAVINKTSNQSIPATTVTNVTWNSIVSSSSDGMVGLSGGNISVNSRVKLMIVVYGNNNSYNGNTYLGCWGLSYPTANSPTTLKTHLFYNNSGVAGTLVVPIYASSAFTYTYDSYWNYLNVFYLYE